MILDCQSIEAGGSLVDHCAYFCTHSYLYIFSCYYIGISTAVFELAGKGLDSFVHENPTKLWQNLGKEPESLLASGSFSLLLTSLLPCSILSIILLVLLISCSILFENMNVVLYFSILHCLEFSFA